MPSIAPPSQPWYKSPWPWFLFSFPAASVVVGISFLITAIQSDDGLVTDDYYKEGKAINMELRRDEKAAQLGLSAQLMIAENQRDLRLVVNSKQALPNVISLHFSHPSQDDYDQKVLLKRVSDNLYQGTLAHKPALAAHWYLQLEDPNNQWRLQSIWRPQEGQGIVFAPPATTTKEQP